MELSANNVDIPLLVFESFRDTNNTMVLYCTVNGISWLFISFIYYKYSCDFERLYL